MTFGLKFAQYLDAVARLQDDLTRHQENVAVLQFGGAAGTLASLGDQASAVSRSLARHLGLNLPTSLGIRNETDSYPWRHGWAC